MDWPRRPCADPGDMALMEALAQRTRVNNLHVTDLPYRFASGALDDPDNTGLWFFPDGRLAAWAVFQAPFWMLDYALDAQAEAELHPLLLAWADARARAMLDTAQGHPCWFVSVFSDQHSRVRGLEAAGYADQGNAGEDALAKVLLTRGGDAPAPVPPPAGFTVRPLKGLDEVPEYVALHRAVFESAAMTQAWRGRTLRHPAYRPGLDLVAQAPGGRLAAFCVCWFDGEAREGRIEPLGCHPDYRGIGLARALLAEGLRRLHALGAREIIVETDRGREAALAAYRSAGFRAARDVLVFRKDYAPVPW